MSADNHTQQRRAYELETNTSLRREAWRYDQPRKRGNNRQYIGHVTYVRGPEADRLRAALAPVIRDLLAWAAAQQDNDDQPTDD